MGRLAGARLRTICSMAKTIRSALLSGLSIVPVTTTVHYDIRLMAISEEYYRYLVVIRNFSISLGDAYLDGLVEPTATYTNVEGGFGIVAGCQLAHRRFTMPFGDKEPSWNPFAVYD